MPVTKQQRKAAAASKAKASQTQAASSIGSFARVSKTVGGANVKKEPHPSTPKKNAKLEAITPASRKRKVVASIESESSADERPKKLAVSPAKKPASAAPAQPARRGRPPKRARPEPTPPKRARSPSVSESDVSNIDTRVLFKKLRLESSPSRSSSPATADTSIAGSDIEPDSIPVRTRELPQEVLSLIDLHAAFLKTLTLHYAHHGSNVPADLRVLCPNIARAWGKKMVTDADIRVCLGILSSPSSMPSCSHLDGSPFRLSNYGRGKICVEIEQSRGFGPLSENKLNALFRGNIGALWAEFLAGKEKSGDAPAFLAALPRAPVALCESVAKASPVLLKGQQRLEDLKRGIALKKQEKANPKVSSSSASTLNTPSSTTTATLNPDGTKMSLLDRIRLKSLQKAALPAGLSPAQLARRAALQRTEEVAALVAMLGRASSSAGDDRVSFAMPTLVDRLKDSLRMGISRPEGAACVRLLAAEVAPEWLRVITLAGREHVVVETARELGKAEVARRVRGILERE
ncbi:hypothetical protein F4802DRAFT_560574 [Xylaria palmicola]|nr:hypothetical protein F4802DRAFT_560574 [Xylaria palmicola]